MSDIRIERVSKAFRGGVQAVDDVSLHVPDGEFMVLVGPSGCGKTTLLRMIAGLEEVTTGRILIGDRDVTMAKPADRDIAMVFQNYALYPHMNVRKNIGYGLKMKRMPAREIDARVSEVARMLELEPFLDRRPVELSGGQRQRVAMGRAIARQPTAFLMDEPLSNLDAQLRSAVRAELARLHARLGVTTIYVTHDQVEAMTLGQRAAVMRNGVIQQVGSPQELYARPTSLFVGLFLGSPAMNLLHGTLEPGGLRLGRSLVPLDRESSPHATGPVIVGIRPEDVNIVRGLAPAGYHPLAKCAVELVEELGARVDVHVWVDVASAASSLSEAAREGVAPLDVRTGRGLVVASTDSRALGPRTSEVEVALDPTTFHFFDPDSHRRLPTGGEKVVIS